MAGEQQDTDKAEQEYWIDHLKFGVRVDIQLLELQKRRYHAELMGLRIGRYIALRYDPNNWPVGEQTTGMMVVCRYLVEETLGEIFAFKAEILQLIRHPDHLIFLAFPKDVFRRSLRDTARSEVNLPATASIGEHSFVGQIIDISEGGCRLVLPQEPAVHEWQQQVLKLVIDCPQSQGATHTAKVRNHREEEEGFCLGLQFEAPQAWVQTLP
ncbi:hypothetical protein GCM10009092_19460 [Bowmanella denitrificans]|uniref:PilZ domain-containing protein n=1 Tax=Bowmanella denitrificans TaxID=366582 RepID=A0ABP3GZ24_9ALTE